MSQGISRREARRQAVVLLYQRDVTGMTLDEVRANGERAGDYAADPYSEALIAGVDTHMAGIDDRLTAAATGWTAERMAPLERNILRVAAFEMQEGEVPTPVLIDEAVEMTKKWCAAEAPGFVNGVLGKMARDSGGAAA